MENDVCIFIQQKEVKSRGHNVLDDPFFQEPDQITIFCHENEPDPITIFLPAKWASFYLFPLKYDLDRKMI